MPRIQRYDSSQVDLRPLAQSNPTASAESFGLGGARMLANAVQGIEGIGKGMMAEEDAKDKALAMEVGNKYVLDLNQKFQEIKQRQGTQAMNSLQDMQSVAEDLKKSYSSQLSGPRQQEYFGFLAETHAQPLFKLAQTHQIEQIAVANETGAAGNRLVNAQQVQLNPTAEALKQQWDMVSLDTDKYKMGVPENARLVLKQEEYYKTLAAPLIDNLVVSGKVGDAVGRLAELQPYIAPAQFTVLQEKVQQAAIEDQSNLLAQQAQASGATLEEQQAALSKSIEGLPADAIMPGYRKTADLNDLPENPFGQLTEGLKTQLAQKAQSKLNALNNQKDAIKREAEYNLVQNDYKAILSASTPDALATYKPNPNLSPQVQNMMESVAHARLSRMAGKSSPLPNEVAAEVYSLTANDYLQMDNKEFARLLSVTANDEKARSHVLEQRQAAMNKGPQFEKFSTRDNQIEDALIRAGLSGKDEQAKAKADIRPILDKWIQDSPKEPSPDEITKKIDLLLMNSAVKGQGIFGTDKNDRFYKFMQSGTQNKAVLKPGDRDAVMMGQISNELKNLKMDDVELNRNGLYTLVQTGRYDGTIPNEARDAASKMLQAQNLPVTEASIKRLYLNQLLSQFQK